MADKTLSIAEKFVIIAHHPERGRFMISQMYIQYGIPGALLLDLTLDDRIDLKDSRLLLKSARVADKGIMGDLATMISGTAVPKKTGYWIRKLARHYNKYLKQILSDLEHKRLVRLEDRKFLGLIPYQKSYLIESYTRSNLIRQLKGSIMVTRDPAGDNMALAGLVEACRMHRLLTTDREELRTIKTQMKKTVKESPVTDAVGKTIREVQAAIMASVTAAIIAPTAGRRH